MSEPTVPPELVVQELCSDAIGRALWERAHYRVLSQLQADRITQLQNQLAADRPPEPPPEQASTGMHTYTPE